MWSVCPARLFALPALLLLVLLITCTRAAATLFSSAVEGESASAATAAAFVPNRGALTFDQLKGRPYNVSYDERAILINGERVWLLAAGVHYPRSSPSMWPQLLQAVRASGCNVVQSYFFHNYHEGERGRWDWSTESRNLGRFLQLAAEHGLFVTLRLGVYVDAEWYNGGVAPWATGQGFQFRQFNAGWTSYMGNALLALNAYIRPYLAQHGGPIIITQIENEYHISSDPNSQAYAAWMVDLIHTLDMGTVWVMCATTNAPDPIIYACNGGGCQYYIPDQQTKRKQPGIWTENWSAWFESWGGSPTITDTRELAFTVTQFAAAGGVYQNYYMYHGGTNFGMTPSQGITTSYDYDGQLDEYGWPSEPKYSHQARLHAVLNAVSPSLLGYPFSLPMPIANSVVYYEYGTAGTNDSVVFFCSTNRTSVTFSFRGRSFTIANASMHIRAGADMALLFDTSVVPTVPSTSTWASAAEREPTLPSQWADSIVWYAEPVGVWSGAPVVNHGPLNQVEVTQYRSQHFWLCTNVTITEADITSGTSNLSLSDAGDNEVFFLDDEFAGVGAGASSTTTLGMSDYGDAFMKRGLNGAVLWHNASIVEQQWVHQVGLEGEFLQLYTVAGARTHPGWSGSPPAGRPLSWYYLSVSTPQPSGDAACATWRFDMRGMGKGSLWCNGFHVGAYWNVRDTHGQYSQAYYHIPRDYLNPPGQQNVVVAFEERGGDPTSVRLEQRNARAQCTNTNPNSSAVDAFAYQGARNVKAPAKRRTAAVGALSHAHGADAPGQLYSRL